MDINGTGGEGKSGDLARRRIQSGPPKRTIVYEPPEQKSVLIVAYRINFGVHDYYNVLFARRSDIENIALPPFNRGCAGSLRRGVRRRFRI